MEAATGYGVSPGSLAGLLGQVGPAFTVSAVGGVFNPSGDGQTITVTSGNSADLISLVGTNATILGPSTGHQITFQPTGVATSFSFSVQAATAGIRAISFFNNEGWEDAAAVSYSADPISELIDLALVVAISSLTSPLSGYGTVLSSVVRGQHTPGPTPENLKAVVYWVGDQATDNEPWNVISDRAGVIQGSTWIRNYQVFVFVGVDETNDNPVYPKLVNTIRADVEKVAMAEIKNSTNLGQTVQNIWTTGAEPTWDANDSPGVSVYLAILYRTNQFDTYSLV